MSVRNLASVWATRAAAPGSDAGDITPMRPHLAHLNKDEGGEAQTFTIEVILLTSGRSEMCVWRLNVQQCNLIFQNNCCHSSDCSRSVVRYVCICFS
jgi:hypothetical protein